MVEGSSSVFLKYFLDVEIRVGMNLEIFMNVLVQSFKLILHGHTASIFVSRKM